MTACTCTCSIHPSYKVFLTQLAILLVNNLGQNFTRRGGYKEVQLTALSSMHLKSGFEGKIHILFVLKEGEIRTH